MLLYPFYAKYCTFFNTLNNHSILYNLLENLIYVLDNFSIYFSKLKISLKNCKALFYHWPNPDE